MKSIVVKSARLHNLKNIDVSIPKNKLVVATGVSGSGKSSLVFDIIFEEGRKQYLQSLGILSEICEEDKFDSIQGLSPSIAVQQSIIRQSNSRSTVGSRTNIINMLAMLYSGEGDSIEERLPSSYFSYNSPNGMCVRCNGYGTYFEVNMEKLVPHSKITLGQVFVSVGLTPGYLRLFQRKYNKYLEIPFLDLPHEIREEVLYGQYGSSSEMLSSCLTKIFHGRIKRGEDLNDLYSSVQCSDCHGFRIGEEARRVVLSDKHIGELGLMTISEVHEFLSGLQKQSFLTQFGKNLLIEILHKTNNLIKARLGHLSLYREMPTLSGGEIQRLFLHSHLDSKMDSLIYVLDEPTAGLHESEKAELLKFIIELKELGNTVIVVEHDKNAIKAAEHIIDIGPKAGVNGGQVIYQGDIEGLIKCKGSITGQYLSGRTSMPARTTKPSIEKAATLTIRHAKTNNLNDVTVSFPLGAMVGIAGLSGSGKSSLVSDTLVPLLRRYFHVTQEAVDENDSGNGFDLRNEFEPMIVTTVADRLEGIENLSGFAEISQAPIGRTSTSSPATYIGIWDKIRKLFAESQGALVQNLTAGHFSFNSKGACDKCGGNGYETIWLGGNQKVDKLCSQCHGKRFNDESLSVMYKGKNIHDVLEMSVSDAVIFFNDSKVIAGILKVLERIGMGYIKLGQPTPTLSGGEAQRIKLAKEIGRRRKGNILYVLDEPTTGLSLYDTAKLIELLDELVAKGNSVIVIEHDTEVLASCDWIIELGPGGGSNGGQIIAEGTPYELKCNLESITGRYL